MMFIFEKENINQTQRITERNSQALWAELEWGNKLKDLRRFQPERKRKCIESPPLLAETTNPSWVSNPIKTSLSPTRSKTSLHLPRQSP